jgi:hypothetical protein
MLPSCVETYGAASGATAFSGSGMRSGTTLAAGAVSVRCPPSAHRMTFRPCADITSASLTRPVVALDPARSDYPSPKRREIR